MSFSISQLVNTLGVQNSDIGQGAIGYEQEKDKFTNQLYVLGVLFVALIFGIVAVALFSTGVSDLESYGDYFNSTGHKVAIGFAVATLITLVVAGVMLDSSLECAEETRARATGRPASPPMPNIIGSVPPYVRAPSPVYRSPTPPPAPVYRQPAPIYRQPVYRQPLPPRRPPGQPPPNMRIAAPVYYPPVPQSPVVYPEIPTQSPTLASQFATALPGLVNAAAPIALAAANAPKGQRGQAALQGAINLVPQ